MHLMLRLRVQVDELEHGFKSWIGMMVHSLCVIDYLHRIQILPFMLPAKARVLIVHHTDYTVRVSKDLYLVFFFERPLSVMVYWVVSANLVRAFYHHLSIGELNFVQNEEIISLRESIDVKHSSPSLGRARLL